MSVKIKPVNRITDEELNKCAKDIDYHIERILRKSETCEELRELAAAKIKDCANRINTAPQIGACIIRINAGEFLKFVFGVDPKDRIVNIGTDCGNGDLVFEVEGTDLPSVSESKQGQRAVYNAELCFQRFPDENVCETYLNIDDLGRGI